MEIDIITPDIFPKEYIISGVTKRNLDNFPPFGLSMAPAEILTLEQVKEHQRQLANYLGIDIKQLKFQHQVHSDYIQVVNYSTGYNNSDGLITNEKGLFLCIKIADCVAVLCYDIKNNAIGAFHSGWRGTRQNIIAKGIEKMYRTYGTKPRDLLVYLSPSASGRSYEVGWDVAQYFPNAIKQISEKKYLFDNKKQIKLQLLECGVNKNNIEISEICTIEDEDYHSYRRDKEKSGRMASFIALK